MDLIKRSCDIFISLFLLIILSLPLLIISAISLLVLGRPVLLRQQRYGKGGKPFAIFKFRTLKNGVPNVSSNEINNEDITAWGSVLRKTSIDELPQLINVIKGDMSLVGPRPLIVEEVYAHELRQKAGVYSVRPGITGYSQINGRDNLAIEEKVRLDKEYIDKRSVLFDIKIILKTFYMVFAQKDINQ